MRPSICAIILAAGTSSRMGQSKQLLPFGNRALLEHTIQRLLDEDFAEVIAVIGHESEAIKEMILLNNERFRWVENEVYLTGQSSSLRVGIENLQNDHSNVMVFLGDLPFIQEETIQLIYQSGVQRMQESEEPFVIRPTFKEAPGHPVFFGNIDKKLFIQLEGYSGGKAIMKKIADQLVLPVKDSGIVYDIDTPEDYVEAKRKWRNAHE